MKSIIQVLIKVSFVLILIYLFVFCFYRLRDDRIGVVKDFSTGEIVLIFNDSYNFIWQGALPWMYSLSIDDTSTTAIINASIAIPSLAALKDDIYSVKIPFSISYRVDRVNPPDKSVFGSRDSINTYIQKFIESICSSVLINYLEPAYNRKELLRKEAELNDVIIPDVIEKLKSAGIICEKLEIMSKAYFPDEALYREGVARCRELRDLDFLNIKQQISVKNGLVKDRSRYELYYERLLKVSGLIKDNPDILKYIYIDKMGDDIKVIISSDKTGIPVMFGNPIGENKSDLNGDIDNLR